MLCGLLPRRDVKPIAKRLIAKFGGVSGVFAASVNALKSVDGIGETVAVYLKAVHALHLASAHETIKKTNILSSWSKVQEYVKTRLQHEATESFRVLFLNRKNGLIEDRNLDVALLIMPLCIRAKLPVLCWNCRLVRSFLSTIIRAETLHPPALT